MALPNTTAQAIITAANKLIGVLGESETLGASAAADGFDVLNVMLDAWGTQKLTMPFVLRTVFPLVNGTASYTFGTGGAINIPQPLEFDAVTLLLTDGITEIPVDIFTDEQWAALPQKLITGTIVRAVYFAHRWNALGQGSIQLWPVPSVDGLNLVLYTPQQWPAFTTLTASYTFPPGFVKALRYNLALELSLWNGVPVSQAVADVAVASLGDVKRINQRPRLLHLDATILGKSSRGVYSIEVDG